MLRAALHNRCTSGWPGALKTLSALLHLSTSWIRKSEAGSRWPLESLEIPGDLTCSSLVTTIIGVLCHWVAPLFQRRQSQPPSSNCDAMLNHTNYSSNLGVTGLHSATVKEMYTLFPMCLHSSPWQQHIQSGFLVFSFHSPPWTSVTLGSLLQCPHFPMDFLKRRSFRNVLPSFPPTNPRKHPLKHQPLLNLFNFGK